MLISFSFSGSVLPCPGSIKRMTFFLIDEAHELIVPIKHMISFRIDEADVILSQFGDLVSRYKTNKLVLSNS